MVPIKEFIINTLKNYPFVALVSIVYREHMVYIDRILDYTNITAGQVPFIIQLLKKEIFHRKI